MSQNVNRDNSDASLNILLSGISLEEGKIDLSFKKGSISCLLGASGSGKTAILVDTLDYLSFQKISLLFPEVKIKRTFRNLKPAYEEAENIPVAVNLSWLVAEGFKNHNIADVFGLPEILSELVDQYAEFYCKKDNCHFEDTSLEKVIEKIAADFELNKSKNDKLILGMRKTNLPNPRGYLEFFREKGFSRLFIDNQFISIDCLLEPGVELPKDFLLVHSYLSNFQVKDFEQRANEMQYDFQEFGEEFFEIIRVSGASNKVKKLSTYYLGKGFYCPCCGQKLNFIDVRILKELASLPDTDATTYEKIALKVFGIRLDEFLKLQIGELLSTIVEILKKDNLDTAIRLKLKKLKQDLKRALELNLQQLKLSIDFQSLGEFQKFKLILIYYLSAQLTEALFVIDNISSYVNYHDRELIHLCFKLLKGQGNTIIFSDNNGVYLELAENLVVLQKNESLLQLTYCGNTTGWKNSFKQISESQIPPYKEQSKSEVVITLNKNKYLVKIPAITAIEFPDTMNSFIALENIAKQLNLVKAKYGIKRVELLNLSAIGKTPVASQTALDSLLAELFANLQSSVRYGLKREDFILSKSRFTCSKCKGVTVEDSNNINDQQMHPLCDVCNGALFFGEVLVVTWNDVNISAALQLTIEDLQKLFNFYPKISSALEIFQELGLEKIRINSKLSELSDAQRILLQLGNSLQKQNQSKRILILNNSLTNLDSTQTEKLLNAVVKRGISLLFPTTNSDFAGIVEYLTLS